MPNSVPLDSLRNKTRTVREVFNHPEDFPIEVRNVFPWKTWLRAFRGATRSDIGLRFFSGSRLNEGAFVRITIPLRHKNNHFEARVVKVKPLQIGFETQVAVTSGQDGERLRVVERICALECELQRALGEDSI